MNPNSSRAANAPRTLPRSSGRRTGCVLASLLAIGIPLAACSAQDPPPVEPSEDLIQGIRCGANGFGDTCHPTCPCSSGGGDCDTDRECESGLACATDIGARFGMRPRIDVCVPPHCINGSLDADQGETEIDAGGPCGDCPENGFGTTCSSASCRCASGRGDCDNDSECQDGLVCAAEFGGRFDMNPAFEVCVPPHCTNGVQDPDRAETGVDRGGACGDCPANGQPDTCRGDCPCAAGWGKCRNDAECQPNLICPTLPNGTKFGFNPEFAVCVPPHCANGVLDSDQNEVKPDCGGACGACETSCTNGLDDDGDGLTDCWDSECPSCGCNSCGCDRDAIECGDAPISCAWCLNGMCQPESDLVFVPEVNGVGELLLQEGILYFSNGTDILTVNTATRELKVLAPASRPTRLAIDQTHLYWTSVATNSVMRVPLRGGKARVFASVDRPVGIAIQGDTVYWVENARRLIRRRAKTGGPASVFWAAGDTKQTVPYIAAEDRYVVFPVELPPDQWGGTWTQIRIYDRETSAFRILRTFYGRVFNPVLFEGSVYLTRSWNETGEDGWGAVGINVATNATVFAVHDNNYPGLGRGSPYYQRGFYTAKRGADVYVGAQRHGSCEVDLLATECAYSDCYTTQPAGIAVDERYLYLLRNGAVYRVLR